MYICILLFIGQVFVSLFVDIVYILHRKEIPPRQSKLNPAAEQDTKLLIHCACIVEEVISF